MPSSTSSSEPDLRPIPSLRWGHCLGVAAVLTAVGLLGWEVYWRAQRFEPAYRNGNGLWATARARVDEQKPGATVVLGSSRLLFDVHLGTWREETGNSALQLAMQGTNPRPFLTDLARNTGFSGLVILGVTPAMFFTPVGPELPGALRYARGETPSQWASQQLSMLIEPQLAFYDFDAALFSIVRRQAFWPVRSGVFALPEVRKFSHTEATRQTSMWSRLEDDAEYRDIIRGTWLDFIHMPIELPPPEVLRAQFEQLLSEVADDVRAIRARGGEVAFIRPPSSGPLLDAERAAFPRERTWDPLLQATGAAGVHFEDYADLQGFELPEWSHLRASDTSRFTRRLVQHLREALARSGSPRAELGNSTVPASGQTAAVERAP